MSLVKGDSIPENRALPKKLKDIFLTLQKLYEKKDYLNGLKAAQQILDKYPNHGETLAMKGLLVHAKGDKEEGHKLVKDGIKNDIKSNVCWHVLGLLHRADGNTKEASKCYLNALRYDEHNQNILRDLSWLQIQSRDFIGFSESRRKLLTIRPSIRANWIAYIASKFFIGDYDIASDLIDKFWLAWSPHTSTSYEDGELVLFQTRCLERQGKYTEAMAQLQRNEGLIVDKFCLQTKLAELSILCGEYDSAVDKWLTILTDNGENYRFHTCLQTALLRLDIPTAINMMSLKRLDLPCSVLTLETSQIDLLIDTYTHKVSFSKSRERILLELTQNHQDFHSHLDTYLKQRLMDGVPSLFQDIKSLCRIDDPITAGRRIYATDPIDLKQHPIVIATKELVDKYICSFQDHGSIHGPDGESDAPTTYLWTLYLHCSLLEMSGEYTEALKVIELCITHTPTAPDMIAKKAKLLKKSGDYIGAAIYMDACRRLDLQDRYLNNKATKYFLRADLMSRAMDTIALFTKHDGDPQKILFELQCNWYENAAGDSYARSGDLGQALKKYLATEKHFTDYYDDMFDFHQFCIRKATLRSYEEVLTMVDSAFTHKYFQRAGRGAIKVYLRLLEPPKPSKETSNAPVRIIELPEEAAHLSAAEQKKLREKIKKQQKKKEKKEKGKGESEAEVGGDEEKESEEDVVLREILSKPPLDEASRLCAELTRFPSADPSSHALAFEVYMAKNKLALAFRCVSCGLNAEPLHPDLTFCLVRFALRIKNNSKVDLQETTQEVLLQMLSSLIDVNKIDIFVNEFAIKAQTLSLPHRLAAAKSIVLVSKSSESIDKAAEIIRTSWDGRGVSIENVILALKFLNDDLNLVDAAEEYKTICMHRFPLANYFGLGIAESLDTDIPFLPQEQVVGAGEV